MTAHFPIRRLVCNRRLISLVVWLIGLLIWLLVRRVQILLVGLPIRWLILLIWQVGLLRRLLTAHHATKYRWENGSENHEEQHSYNDADDQGQQRLTENKNEYYQQEKQAAEAAAPSPAPTTPVAISISHCFSLLSYFSYILIHYILRIIRVSIQSSHHFMFPCVDVVEIAAHGALDQLLCDAHPAPQ